MKIKMFILFIVSFTTSFGFKMEGITFNKSLENGYKEYKISNNGTKKTWYKVKILPSGDKDITGNIEVSPKILTIGPNSYETLKIFGTGKEKLEDKEYKFIVDFQQIVIPTLQKVDGKVIKGNSIIPLSPSVEMKGHGGIIDYSKKLELENIEFFKDKRLKVKGILANNSHGAVELGLNFYNRDKSVMASEGQGVIAAKSKKDIVVDLGAFNKEKDIKYIEFYNDSFEVLKSIELWNYRSSSEEYRLEELIRIKSFI